MQKHTREITFVANDTRGTFGCLAALLLMAVLWLIWFVILPVVGLMYLMGGLQ